MPARTFVLAAVLLLLPAALAFAADDTVDGLAQAVSDAAEAPRTQAATVATIARVLALPRESLRAEQGRVHLGWGDVFVAHRIATRGGHPLEKVFAARRTGVAWRLIAEEAQIDAAQVEKDLRDAFPGLAPVTPRPIALPPKAPEKPPETPAAKVPDKPANDVPDKAQAKPPEKKPTFTERVLDLFRGDPASKEEPAGKPADDWKNKQREEEKRDFIRGERRR